tara:strand:+ start:73 stop:1071 length:999 start_codon:yes stop_codon:yes gene_type:complete
MGVISLKFGTEDFSSLQVNDYVYYTDTNVRRDYIVNNTSDASKNTTTKLLGPVKQINKSIPVLVRSFDLDRNHYYSFDNAAMFESSTSGAFNLIDGNSFKFNTNFLVEGGDANAIASSNTFDFGGGRIAKVGDTVNFLNNPGNQLSSTTGTILGFELITAGLGDRIHYVLGTSSSDNFVGSFSIAGINYETVSSTRFKILMSDTTGISQGMFVKGGSLPGGGTPSTTVTNVVEDVSITLSNLAITSGSSTQSLTFSHDNTVTAKPFEVLVYIANDDVDLPTHANTPYYFFVKDTSVNTSGLLGYYAEVKLANNSTSKAELFSIGSEVFQSSK